MTHLYVKMYIHMYIHMYNLGASAHLFQPFRCHLVTPKFSGWDFFYRSCDELIHLKRHQDLNLNLS